MVEANADTRCTVVRGIFEHAPPAPSFVAVPFSIGSGSERPGVTWPRAARRSFALALARGRIRGSKPKPAALIRLLKTAESLGTTMRHMDARLCDTSTMDRKKPKISHIGRHFIKAPQTMAWSDSQHRGWINSAGLGLDSVNFPNS
jgi:hypothetical protein